MHANCYAFTALGGTVEEVKGIDARCSGGRSTTRYSVWLSRKTQRDMAFSADSIRGHVARTRLQCCARFKLREGQTRPCVPLAHGTAQSRWDQRWSPARPRAVVSQKTAPRRERLTRTRPLQSATTPNNHRRHKTNNIHQIGYALFCKPFRLDIVGVINLQSPIT